MKNIFCLLLLCLGFACSPSANFDSKTSSSGKEASTDAKKVPGKNVVGNAGTTHDGQETTTATARLPNDLNGDGEPDRLEVVTTAEENDGLGFKRQLIVYTGEGADLDAWYTANDVILSTEHGGMMGDPLESVKIENGTIVIKHFGGGRTKWAYAHRFRWQNGDFELIGTTIENDDPCLKYTKLDYNLSTNVADYATTSKECIGDKARELETITVSFTATVFLPSMNGFKTGENELKAEGMEEGVYF